MELPKNPVEAMHAALGVGKAVGQLVVSASVYTAHQLKGGAWGETADKITAASITYYRTSDAPVSSVNGKNN